MDKFIENWISCVYVFESLMNNYQVISKNHNKKKVKIYSWKFKIVTIVKIFIQMIWKTNLTHILVRQNFM